MDKAREAAARADRQMRVLATEVADVPRVSAELPGLQLDGATRFLDVWFGNIFTDWSVRERITDARGNTDLPADLPTGNTPVAGPPS